MKNRIRKQQSGFTLIEIAIVLVIIGILIVGVLQGQEMIENSKTKSIVATMKGVGAAYNSYLDRYRAIPGDELAATTAARGWTTMTANGNGNGVLLAPLGNAFNPAVNEGLAFWQAEYAAGYLQGNPAATGLSALPTHAGGGKIGIAAGAAVYGMSGVFVCASNLSTKQAAAIDLAIDGPVPTTSFGNTTGILRGTNQANPNMAPTGPGAPANAAYDEVNNNNLWTMCLKIG